jgi:hypothetical protein
MEHTRKLRILNIFVEAVEKARASRKGINVELGGADELAGIVRAQVTVVSEEGKFKLHFVVGANNEIAAYGPNGSIRCSLTADSIGGAVREEIERELGLRPIEGAI